MCIIAVKGKGVQYPSVEQIINCMTANPDGFAMAWNEGGKVKTFRSMSDTKFLKVYKRVMERCKAEDTGLVFHARIATHGSKGIKNCHCWEGARLAFAHNGILSVANRDDMTDSETFFRDIFLPIYKTGGWDEAAKAVKCVIGTSKFAFLDGTGKIKLYGRYVEEGDGAGKKLYFSNDTYKSWRERYAYGFYGSGWSKYGGATRLSAYDDLGRPLASMDADDNYGRWDD